MLQTLLEHSSSSWQPRQALVAVLQIGAVSLHCVLSTHSRQPFAALPQPSWHWTRS
jgi:hypothetical protein